MLLGDACHALHPGRSQGMNVAIRSVAALANRLRAAGPRDDIPAMLRAFENEVRPPIDARLGDNHARGLEMDRMDADAVECIQAKMAELESSPDRKRAYCMNAAGY